MRFRLHLIIAIAGAMLLLPFAARAQQAPAKPAQQSAPPAAEEATPPTGQEPMAAGQENTLQAPIEPVLSGAYPPMSKAAEERGRQIFQMFNQGESSQMWASLSEGLRSRSGKEENLVQANKKMRDRMGTETEVLEDNMVPYIFAPDTVYSRLSTFSKVKVPVIASITINQRGQIDNFSINFMPTVAEGRYAGYQDTATLKLPFNGEWLVYQGGRNPFENGYSLSDDQRYGLDFVYLKNGRLFSGRGGIGSKAEDYYCFGQPILAPADGTVVKAEKYYDDNPPGKPTGDSADGNIVEISHGNGESSVMNHLKQNSLKVKLGDKVKQGDVVAECGNSGAGPIPHIHYQLQKSAGVVLPAQFVDYVAAGKPVASGEPKRGQYVKNGAAAAASSGTSMKDENSNASATAASSSSSMPAQKAQH